MKTKLNTDRDTCTVHVISGPACTPLYQNSWCNISKYW